MQTIQKPFPNTYWVIPGKLLAGEYPGDAQPERALDRLSRLVACGISQFIDLTTPYDSLAPYQPLLEQLLHPQYDIRYQRFPINNLDIPQDKAYMTRILDAIEEGINEGRAVYVHCWGGIGRTGTTVGCYLARQGYRGEAALAELSRLWQGCARSAYTDSPETPAQRHYIVTWDEQDNSPE